MTLESIYYVSQLLSTIALVCSVIYLGLQTKLEAKSNFAQMHQARSEQVHEIALMLTGAEFGPLASAGFRGDLALDDEQVRRFYFYAMTILRIQEETYRQWRERAIAIDRWKSTEQTLRSMVRTPGYRACFWGLRKNLDEAFVELVEKMIKQDGPASQLDVAAEWREGVRRALAGGG